MLQKKSWHKQDETYYHMPLRFDPLQSNPPHYIISHHTIIHHITSHTNILLLKPDPYPIPHHTIPSYHPIPDTTHRSPPLIHHTYPPLSHLCPRCRTLEVCSWCPLVIWPSLLLVICAFEGRVWGRGADGTWWWRSKRRGGKKLASKTGIYEPKRMHLKMDWKIKKWVHGW